MADDIKGLVESVQDYLGKGGLDEDVRSVIGPHAYEGLSNIAALANFFGPGADIEAVASESEKVMEGDPAAFVGLPAALAMMVLPGSKSGIEEVTETAVKQIAKKLEIDNPGGSWLRNKKEEAAKAMAKAEPNTYRKNLGTPAITGYHEGVIELDPKQLADVPGAMGEELHRVSGRKLPNLQKSIEQEGYNPSPIMIHVREDGKPFIVEGNTRVAEAIISDRPTIQAEIKYLRGAEDVEGPLSPDKIFPGSKSGIEEVTETAVKQIPYPSIKKTWWKDELADKGSVTLYHGAARENFDSILKSGLKADQKGFSYLTPDPATGTGYAVMSRQGGEKAFKGAKNVTDTPVEDRILLEIEVPEEAILENITKQRSPTSMRKLVEESGENFTPTVQSSLGKGKYTEPYYSLTEFRLNQDIPSEWITGYAVKKASGGIVMRNPYNYEPKAI